MAMGTICTWKLFVNSYKKEDSVHIGPSQPPYILYSPALIWLYEITFVGDLSDLGSNELEVYYARRIQNLLSSIKI